MTYHRDQIKVRVDRRKDHRITVTIKLVNFEPTTISVLAKGIEYALGYRPKDDLMGRLGRALYRGVIDSYTPDEKKLLPDNIIGGS